MSGRVKSAPGDRDAEQREVETEGLSPARWVRDGGGRGVCSGTVAPSGDAGGQSGPPRAGSGGIPVASSCTSPEWATSWEDDGVAARTSGKSAQTQGIVKDPGTHQGGEGSGGGGTSGTER